jgi:hypothetical protein
MPKGQKVGNVNFMWAKLVFIQIDIDKDMDWSMFYFSVTEM